MRLGGKAVALAALTAGATALPACYIGGPGEPSLVDCKKVRLVVDPVRGMTRENVVLRARLTQGGDPVQGQKVVLRVRKSSDDPILWSLGGLTGPDGAVAVDFADAIRRFRFAAEAFDGSRVVEAVFRNPAETDDAPRPGFCSTSDSAPFEPAR